MKKLINTNIAFQQNAKVFWLTGLSGSGKTTIANALRKKLNNLGYAVQILDGDNIRKGLNSDLGFSLIDRKENIRRVSEIAKLFIENGIITIVSFISPTSQIRNLARKIISKERFIEIFVDAPLEICVKRDIKGLYKQARAGELKNFTGIDSPFEKPKNADLILKTSEQSIEQSVEQVLALIEYDN